MVYMNKRFNPELEIVLHKNIRFNEQLTWGEKIFIAEVKSFCSNGKCYYDQKALSELFHVAPLTIATWVKNLANAGLLEIHVDPNDPICKPYLKSINKG